MGDKMIIPHLLLQDYRITGFRGYCYGWFLYSRIILDNLKNFFQHTFYRVIYRVIAFCAWRNRVLESNYKCHNFVPNLEFRSWQTIFFALIEYIGLISQIVISSLQLQDAYFILNPFPQKEKLKTSI